MTEEHDTQDAARQVYELGYHILPTVTADELDAEVAKIRTVIEKRGGSFIAEGTPETVALAHTMTVNMGGKLAKYDKAYFGWMKFEMDTEQAVTLGDEDIKSNPQVLRFVLFKTTSEETRAQLQSAQHNVLREVKTEGTLERKHVEEEGGEVSEEALEKSIDELVGEKETEEQEVEKEEK